MVGCNVVLQLAQVSDPPSQKPVVHQSHLMRRGYCSMVDSSLARQRSRQGKLKGNMLSDWVVLDICCGDMHL